MKHIIFARTTPAMNQCLSCDTLIFNYYFSVTLTSNSIYLVGLHEVVLFLLGNQRIQGVAFLIHSGKFQLVRFKCGLILQPGVLRSRWDILWWHMSPLLKCFLYVTRLDSLENCPSPFCVKNIPYKAVLSSDLWAQGKATSVDEKDPTSFHYNIRG